MPEDVLVKNGISIPYNELIFTVSRASGPGGQHVNKASTRISVRWNIATSQALTSEQKERAIQKLKSRLTSESEIIIHNSSSRSQLHNKKAALQELAKTIRKALHIPKKRIKTKISKGAREARLKEKRVRSEIKKMREKIKNE